MKYPTLALTALLTAVAEAALPNQPPPLAGAGLPDFEVPSTCSFLYGDPHILTWDNQHADCMSDGDFLMAKSSSTDFEIQSRFYEATEEMKKKHYDERGWHVGTGTKAIVVNTGNDGEPVIEVNAEVPQYHDGKYFHNDEFVGCALKYYVDGDLLTLDDNEVFGDNDNVVFQRTKAVEPNIWNKTKTNTNHYRNFYFKDSGVFLQVRKSYWDRYGCYMDARICIPDSIKEENLYGILGDANGDKNNDFKTKFHENVVPPPSSDAEKQVYCEENWCVKNNEDSMFNDPDILNGCQSDHSEVLDKAVKNASPKIKKDCHQDEDCIKDTIITGDINIGLQTLQDKTNFENGENIGGTVTSDSEDGICVTGEDKSVDCESYEHEFVCETIGYDFGYRMQGCDSNGDGAFTALMLTDSAPTCPVGNTDIGSFTIDCGEGTDATITPTVDTVVKVSGSTKGTLYKGLKAGETYTLTTAKESEKEMIENIEFCFKCPTTVIDNEIVACTADVMTCEDGTQLSRVAEDNCAFPACPEPVPGPTCAAVYKQCGGKDWTGPTDCAIGFVCSYKDDSRSVCKPPMNKSGSRAPEHGTAAIHERCGGGDWKGPTKCMLGTYCWVKNGGWSNCKANEELTCPDPDACALMYGQCGGKDWEGTTTCSFGSSCTVINDDLSKCMPPAREDQDAGAATVHNQCGGKNWKGVTTCHTGSYCRYKDPWRSECKPMLYAVCPEPEEPEVIIEEPIMPIRCTADVKECWDGSYAERTGENCEFAPCPDEPLLAPPKPKTEPEPPLMAPPKASGSGDPHFKTWFGDKFDYHGECDLVLIDNPSFNNGQGLKVHIRTTRVKYFSFIEKVAIQIGEEILEFDNDAENFLINGEPVGENKKHHKTMLGGYIVRRDARAISLRLREDSAAIRQTGMTAKIDLHTRKNGFPAVIVDGGHTDAFKGSLGLLGEWQTGRKLGRDGVTVFEVDPEDAAAFALEWQVRDTEPMLFKDARFPQFPTTCTPATKMVMSRLGASKAKQEAEEACAHWKEDMEDCIFDVIATRDVLVAEEGHIVHIE